LILVVNENCLSGVLCIHADEVNNTRSLSFRIIALIVVA